MENNYIAIINKDGVKAENYMKSFEILDRFLKVEQLSGAVAYINIDTISAFYIGHKD